MWILFRLSSGSRNSVNGGRGCKNREIYSASLGDHLFLPGKRGHVRLPPSIPFPSGCVIACISMYSKVGLQLVVCVHYIVTTTLHSVHSVQYHVTEPSIPVGRIALVGKNINSTKHN